MDPLLSILSQFPDAVEAIRAFYESPWFRILSAVVTSATAVVIITPNNVDNAVIKVLRDVFSWLSGNFGHNAVPPVVKKK